MAYKKLRLSLRPLVEKVIADMNPSNDQVSASNLRMRAETHLPEIFRSYDPNQYTKLKTWIVTKLSGYLRNAKKENLPGPYVPRNQRPDLERYRGAMRDAEMEYGNNPTEDQIRSFYPHDEAGMDFDQIKQYHVNSYLGDAIHGADDESDGLTFKDQFADADSFDEDDMFAGIEDEEQDQQIDQQFNPAEKEIIDLVAKQGKSFAEVALTLGIDTSQIRKTIRRWHDLTQQQSY
jgi:RNA polymerase sigma factor (sigma-70 family)